MGSKNRIAKHILPIMLKYRTPEMTWVEPFVGGANMIDKVEGKRIGGEYNKYIAEMWKALEAGWIPRSDYTKDDYYNIKANMDRNPAEAGYVGIAVSYCGKWFGGYAGLCDNKSRGPVDYQKQAYNNLIKQLPNIKGIKFIHSSYQDLEIPPNSLIYCDPPYESTTKYKDDFNHAEFWQWCRDKSKEGHTVFVSEYNAPDDFYCIKKVQTNTQLGNGCQTGSQNKCDKLFTPMAAIADKERGLF